MKLTSTQLRRIIKEEVQRVTRLNEVGLKVDDLSGEAKADVTFNVTFSIMRGQLMAEWSSKHGYEGMGTLDDLKADMAAEVDDLATEVEAALSMGRRAP